MAPGASIVLYSEFTVTENKEKEYTNTVELIGALADDNYFLDTGKDYKASVGFTVKKVLTPAVIVGPLTEDGIVKYIFVFTVSTACLILAAVQIRKHISIQKRTLKRIGIFVGSFAGTILLLATAGKVIAANNTVPVKSVTLTSTHTSYESNEPGSWNIEKSARWTGQGKAQITFDVSSIMKTSEGHKDLIFVLDNSGSMSGDKLARVKHDASELIESLLSDDQNRAALVNFNSNAKVLSTFTNDKDSLLEKIDALNDTGCTNYYQGFLKVEDVLDG